MTLPGGEPNEAPVRTPDVEDVARDDQKASSSRKYSLNSLP